MSKLKQTDNLIKTSVYGKKYKSIVVECPLCKAILYSNNESIICGCGNTEIYNAKEIHYFKEKPTVKQEIYSTSKQGQLKQYGLLTFGMLFNSQYFKTALKLYTDRYYWLLTGRKILTFKDWHRRSFHKIERTKEWINFNSVTESFTLQDFFKNNKRWKWLMYSLPVIINIMKELRDRKSKEYGYKRIK